MVAQKFEFEIKQNAKFILQLIYYATSSSREVSSRNVT